MSCCGQCWKHVQTSSSMALAGFNRVQTFGVEKTHGRSSLHLKMPQIVLKQCTVLGAEKKQGLWKYYMASPKLLRQTPKTHHRTMSILGWNFTTAAKSSELSRILIRNWRTSMNERSSTRWRESTTSNGLPKWTPTTHQINKDMREFILTGAIPSGSSVFIPVFGSLQKAGMKVQGHHELWLPSLFATKDFSTTILTRDRDPNSGTYLRPVN